MWAEVVLPLCFLESISFRCLVSVIQAQFRPSCHWRQWVACLNQEHRREWDLYNTSLVMVKMNYKAHAHCKINWANTPKSDSVLLLIFSHKSRNKKSVPHFFGDVLITSLFCGLELNTMQRTFYPFNICQNDSLKTFIWKNRSPSLKKEKSSSIYSIALLFKYLIWIWEYFIFVLSIFVPGKSWFPSCFHLCWQSKNTSLKEQKHCSSLKALCL